MRGGAHTTYQSDPAKREQWLAEMAARPEVHAGDLLGLFNDPEFIERIDAEQRRLQEESIASLIGFSAMDETTKDEARLFQIARSNVALYEDDFEDIIYDDPILQQLLKPEVRDINRANEQYSEAIRLRRTVVAYFLVYSDYLSQQAEAALDSSNREAV